MATEYRFAITATFANSTKRDNAYNALKSQIQNYATNNPGDLKRADMTRDDYYLPDRTSEQVV